MRNQYLPNWIKKQPYIQCSEYPHLSRIYMNNEEIENPPLWLLFFTGIWTLLAMFGIFSFGMMCLGYWWAKL
jgi:hypothetical protein